MKKLKQIIVKGKNLDEILENMGDLRHICFIKKVGCELIITCLPEDLPTIIQFLKENDVEFEVENFEETIELQLLSCKLVEKREIFG